MVQNNFCKIFVDTNMEYQGFVILINDFVNGDIFMGEIESKYLSISIIKNEDYDSALKYDNSSGAFVYYKYYLEVEPSENIDLDTYLMQLKSLVNFLRSKGFRTIPSCEFEDELNDEKPYTEFMK